MATIKSYTDLEQSKKLVEILPLESADMYYYPFNDDYAGPVMGRADKESITCWSLATLLEQFPYELRDGDGNSSYLQIYKDDYGYKLVYADPSGNFESIETNWYEHFVDACVAMIERLHELKML